MPIHTFCAALLTILLGSTLTALEPTRVLPIGKDGGASIVCYAPATADGRVVLMLGPDATADGRPEAALLPEITRMTAGGCWVLYHGPATSGDRRSNGHVYEKLWDGAIKAVAKDLPDGGARLVFLPSTHHLADPVPFFVHDGKTLFLDIAYPVNGRSPAHGLIRVRSGTFGAAPLFFIADHGYALAHISDPFYELHMDGTTAIAYGRAAAKTFRSQSTSLHLSGKLAIGGKSKHGFAAGVLGAGSTYTGSDPSGDYQAVLAMTDTYSQPHRREDFIAAGHRVDGAPGDGDDPRGSPAELVQPGAPAFYLCDAHGRDSRQVDRMIEALQRHGVPFQQGWTTTRPQYLEKKPENMLAFLDRQLGPR